jgi:hypothetical protein
MYVARCRPVLSLNIFQTVNSHSVYFYYLLIFRLRYGLHTPSASALPLRRGTNTGLGSSCHLMLVFIRHNRYKCILSQRHAQPPIKSRLLFQIPLLFARLYVLHLYASLSSGKRRTKRRAQASRIYCRQCPDDGGTGDQSCCAV